MKLWDNLENFSGPAAALQKDGKDIVHLALCRVGKPVDGYPLTDAEWIHWQNVIEAAPTMLRILRDFVTPGAPVTASLIEEGRALLAKLETETAEPTQADARPVRAVRGG